MRNAKEGYTIFQLGAGKQKDTSYPDGIKINSGVFVKDVQFIQNPYWARSSALTEAFVAIITDQKWENEVDVGDLEGRDGVIIIDIETFSNDKIKKLCFDNYFDYFEIRIIRNTIDDETGFHTILRTVMDNVGGISIKPPKRIRPDKFRRDRNNGKNG